MSLHTLQDLLIGQLKDIYNAEKQIIKALPKLARTATHESLADAFSDHLNETYGQITRLEEVFEFLHQSPRGPKCKGMEGLLAEGADTANPHSAPGAKPQSLQCRCGGHV